MWRLQAVRRRRLIWLAIASLLIWTMTVLTNHLVVTAAMPRRSGVVDTSAPLGSSAPALAEMTFQPGERPRPALSNDAYVRPDFAREMRALRPAIFAAAQRHNRPELSGMNDHDFALVIAALLYNEHSGWFEEEVKPVRSLTPFYESLQVQANGAGANLSIWPANLRPSVAAEILAQHIPVPGPTLEITRSITVVGSAIDLRSYASTSALYAAISHEIAQPELAVEYLAANLERGLYRANFEHVAVTWRTLAAWHNQGVIAPREITANATVASYVRRTSAYLPAARRLIDTPTQCHYLRCQLGDAGEFAPATMQHAW